MPLRQPVARALERLAWFPERPLAAATVGQLAWRQKIAAPKQQAAALTQRQQALRHWQALEVLAPLPARLMQEQGRAVLALAGLAQPERAAAQPAWGRSGR